MDGSVDWSDTSGFIQESGRNAVEPGQALTATTYLVVFHSDVPPQFDRWSLDYDFAAAPPAGEAVRGRTETQLGSTGSGPIAATAAEASFAGSTTEEPWAATEGRALPSGISVGATCGGKWAEIVREMEGRGIAGVYKRGWDKLERTRKDLFGGCWQQVENQPGCYYFESFARVLLSRPARAWTGPCSGGIANGTGELLSGDRRETGEVRDGKQEGHWVVYANGRVSAEGPYVDGRKHGLWVEDRSRDGKVREVLYENSSIEKVRRWKNPDRNRDEGGWGRVATAVLGGAAIAAAGDGSELAVEAGLGFAEEVLGDGRAGSGPGLTVDSSPDQESPLSGIPGCQEFSAPALENDRQAWAHCGNAYANSCRIRQISDPSYKAKHAEVSQARIDQGIAESRAIISRSCQAITVTGSSVSDCSYCKQP